MEGSALVSRAGRVAQSLTAGGGGERAAQQPVEVLLDILWCKVTCVALWSSAMRLHDARSSLGSWNGG